MKPSMQPNNSSGRNKHGLSVPPPRGLANTHQRDAALQIMRANIDQIYDNGSAQTSDSAPAPEQLAAENPADTATHHRSAPSDTHHRNHNDHAAHAGTAGQWQHYHSAWQSYYQQYYERYYQAQLHKRSQQSVVAPTPSGAIASTEYTSNDDDSDNVTQLQAKLLGTVKQRAVSVRKSRHFMPLISAAVVAMIVLSLQYNRIFEATVRAYVSPGSISAQNIILDPTTDTKVGPEPRIIIPKINVDAPVVFDVGSLEEAPVQNALRGGVVHYPIPGASSVPGQTGNSVLLGHSSNDVFDSGNYKFVFVQLEKVAKGDSFYVHSGGTRYTYTVTKTETIKPTDIAKLTVPTEKPTLSLVTCTPVGTAINRFVVTAEQISPDPGANSRPSAPASNGGDVLLPGQTPTLIERLFGR